MKIRIVNLILKKVVFVSLPIVSLSSWSWHCVNPSFIRKNIFW